VQYAGGLERQQQLPVGHSLGVGPRPLTEALGLPEKRMGMDGFRCNAAILAAWRARRPRSRGQKACHPADPPQEKVQVFSSRKGVTGLSCFLKCWATFKILKLLPMVLKFEKSADFGDNTELATGEGVGA